MSWDVWKINQGGACVETERLEAGIANRDDALRRARLLASRHLHRHQPRVTFEAIPAQIAWQDPTGLIYMVEGFSVTPLGVVVRMYSYGGGLAYEVPLHHFTKFRAAEFTWRKVLVTGDWCDPGESYEAWWNGERWNGWVCPMFEPEVVGRMASRASFLNLYHRNVGGVPTWLARQDDTEPAETFPLTRMDVGFSTLSLYPIGKGSWCWELAEETADVD